MFTRSLASRGIVAISVDPGSEHREIARLLRWSSTPAQRAAAVLCQLCPPAPVRNGAFYLGPVLAEPAAFVEDGRALDRLWRRTEQLLAQY